MRSRGRPRSIRFRKSYKRKLYSRRGVKSPKQVAARVGRKRVRRRGRKRGRR